MNLKVAKVSHIICICLIVNGSIAEVKNEIDTKENKIVDQEATDSKESVIRQRRGNHEIELNYPNFGNKLKYPRPQKIFAGTLDEPKVMRAYMEIHDHRLEPHQLDLDSKSSEHSYEIPSKKEEYEHSDDSEHVKYVEAHHHIPEKVKHHHHHHHHIKTIIKKIAHPVSVKKIVHVPVEKVIHVPKPYPVEKIVEKIVHVPVEKVVHVPKPYPVEKVVEKVIHVPVEKVVYVAKPYPVEKVVHVPVEKIVKVPVEKIVEKIVHVPKPYPVIKMVSYPVEVKVPVHIPQPYPVEKKVSYPIEGRKKINLPDLKSYNFEEQSLGESDDHISSNYFEHDYSSQGSRVHSVKIPQNFNFESKPTFKFQQSHEFQTNERPSQQQNNKEEILQSSKSQLHYRGPQMFPSSSQVSQQSPSDNQRFRYQRHSRQPTNALTEQTFQRPYVGNNEADVSTMQGEESVFQPSFANAPKHGTLLQDNVQLLTYERLQDPQALVQPLKPSNYPHLSVNLLPMEPIVGGLHASLNTNRSRK